MPHKCYNANMYISVIYSIQGDIHGNCMSSCLILSDLYLFFVFHRCQKTGILGTDSIRTCFETTASSLWNR